MTRPWSIGWERPSRTRPSPRGEPFAGVCINLVRNPRWGRTQESYGEDPFLLGEFGRSLTVSLQEEGVIACVKHFALNSMEDLRFYVDVHIDDRALHEGVSAPFQEGVDAGAQSIMGAYNRYEEYHCCENKKLLTDILRREWGFDGFVMSDFVWGVYDAEHSLRAGLDLEMMFTMKYSEGNIRKCLKKGLLNEEHIDRAVDNILRALLRMEPKIRKRPMSVVRSKEHRALALEAAEKGMVLLENNGVLPLAKGASVIVCGPYADVANTGDHGSSRVYDPEVVTPYQGLREVFAKTTLAGPSNTANPKKAPKPVENSAAIRAEGDVAVVCVGFDYKGEGEYFVNTNYALTEKPKDGGGDRLRLRLSREEVDLIKGLKKAGKKVVAVLFSGCAILVDEWKEYADAIVMNYYAGCEGGRARWRLSYSARRTSAAICPLRWQKRRRIILPSNTSATSPMRLPTDIITVIPFWIRRERTRLIPSVTERATQISLWRRGGFQDSDGVLVRATVRNTGSVDGAQVVQVYAGSMAPRTVRIVPSSF